MSKIMNKRETLECIKQYIELREPGERGIVVSKYTNEDTFALTESLEESIKAKNQLVCIGHLENIIQEHLIDISGHDLYGHGDWDSYDFYHENKVLPILFSHKTLLITDREESNIVFRDIQPNLEIYHILEKSEYDTIKAELIELCKSDRFDNIIFGCGVFSKPLIVDLVDVCKSNLVDIGRQMMSDILRKRSLRFFNLLKDINMKEVKSEDPVITAVPEKTEPKPEGKKLRIGIFCSGSNPVPPKNYGGTQVVNHMISEKLVKLGHQVYLFAPSGSKSSGKLITITTGWGQQYENQNVKNYLSKHIDELDVLLDTSAFAIPSERWKDIPYLNRMGGDPKKNYCRYPNRNIVFPSKAHADFHSQGDCECSKKRKAMGCEPVVVYKPVCYPGKLEDIRISDGDNKGYYLCLGLVNNHKGTHFAIELAKKANIRLRIVGPKGEPAYFNSKIRPHLNDKITYENAINIHKKWDLLRGAVATIFTTNCHEGQPNVPMESLLVGTPVISFNKDAAAEIVADKETGVLAGTIDEMVDRIKEIESIDIKTCRSSVLEKFSLERHTEEYLKLIDRVMKGDKWI